MQRAFVLVALPHMALQQRGFYEERLLKDLDEDFKKKGITYQVLQPKELKSRRSSQGVLS